MMGELRKLDEEALVEVLAEGGFIDESAAYPSNIAAALRRVAALYDAAAEGSK